MGRWGAGVAGGRACRWPLHAASGQPQSRCPSRQSGRPFVVLPVSENVADERHFPVEVDRCNQLVLVGLP